jgi:dihydroneopterin triphosphate aldolase (PTPS-III) / 6-pyruvoyltetrahydropterin synthase
LIVIPQKMTGIEQEFEVAVNKSDMKFSCAHFIAYSGFREKLHGHNYNLTVRLTGARLSTGYLIDFGIVKKVCRKMCKDLNERFICPMKSNVLQIEIIDDQVSVITGR